MAGERNTREVTLAWRHLWAILLLVVAAVTLFSLPTYSPYDVGLNHVPPKSPTHNMIGPVGAWIGCILFWTLGVAAYLVPIAALIFAVVLFYDKEERVWPHVAWFLLSMTALTNLLELHGSPFRSLCGHLNIVDPGGFISHTLTDECLLPLVNRVGTAIILWIVFILSTVLMFGIDNVIRAAKAVRHGFNWLVATYNVQREERLDRRDVIDREERKVKRRMRLLEMEKEPAVEAAPVKPAAKPERPTRTRVPEPEPVDDEDAEKVLPLPEPEPPAAKREPIKPAKPEPEKEIAREPVVRPEPVVAPVKKATPPIKPTPQRLAGGTTYILPPLDLLSEIPKVKGAESTIDETTTGRVLVETLAEFGVEVELTASKRGPVVTSYELLPAPGVRVEQIARLSNNISLALKSAGVRIQAPIPGKGVVGIEVPNASSAMVCMREVVESEIWQSGKLHLPLALGKDVGGKDLVVDLAAMPHMLIAGATGAGKTVCMNSILTGLLMARTPDELRMILVDPKIVEFSTYNDLPHLVIPVVTNPKKVAIALRWAIAEMEKRYKMFAKVGVRNIEGFNTRPAQKPAEPVVRQADLFATDAPAPAASPPPEEPKDEIPAKVPYIVIVIDELADLMLVDQAEIENCIARLAQLSRAVGIHMILATQRPSVKVITGTIKANFPARISFQVAQQTDSRTILDTVGAEKLLGKGDMLYLHPSNSKLIRAQGAYTRDEEINRVVDYIKKQGTPIFVPEIHDKLERTTSASMDDGQEDDDLIDSAIQVIRETQRASTSSLQRRLRIGYTRAARLMDILEERGIIGPPRGSDAREILIDLDSQAPGSAGAPPPGPTPPTITPGGEE